MKGSAELAAFVPLSRIVSMDNFDRKIRRFLVDEGYLFPITDAEIERALKELEQMFIAEIFSVKDKLPDVECGSFLVYAPKSFPKNSRWLVAEYYNDVKGFYSESGEFFMEDVTHWCKLPDEPNDK